jgi:hypothetical protein
MSRFAHFVAIDWSGAAGNGTRALPWRNAAPDRAPTLVRPGHRWSRAEVLHWLRHDLPRDSLVGMDLGQSLPFVDCGAFFPGWAESPPDARALWAMVDAACTDEPHLGVNRFVDASEPARHFRRHGGRCGDRFPRARSPARNRARAQEAMGCKPYSNFNLVGAAQVGKSSLSGCACCTALRATCPSGRSIPCLLRAAWSAKSTPPSPPWPPAARPAAPRSATAPHSTPRWRPGQRPLPHRPDRRPPERRPDHGRLAAHRGRRAPCGTHAALTPEIARTEGWTFGAS